VISGGERDEFSGAPALADARPCGGVSRVQFGNGGDATDEPAGVQATARSGTNAARALGLAELSRGHPALVVVRVHVELGALDLGAVVFAGESRDARLARLVVGAAGGAVWRL
jgi:hypothetical protein